MKIKESGKRPFIETVLRIYRTLNNAKRVFVLGALSGLLVTSVALGGFYAGTQVDKAKVLKGIQSTNGPS